jgi:UDP-4-amino-4,6-dideoxy-N-acetyl-beta-L-altrosamine N-acetyltransferase
MSIVLSSSTRLRPVAEDDLAMILAWRNHPFVREYMFDKCLIQPDQHFRWFLAIQDHSSHWAFIFEKNAQPCGFVQFKQDEKNQAEWGFYIAPGQVKGTGKALGRCALDYAFENKSFEKILGKSLPENHRSVRFHESLGFVKEGVSHRQSTEGPNSHAVICFGLTADQWQHSPIKAVVCE